MAEVNFEECTAWVLVHEGGYVNHPDDPGGATNKGVIQRTYDGYRRRMGQPTRSVRFITMEEVLDIYRDQYWNLVRADQLPSGLDYAMYDFAINSGPKRAVQFIQRLVGVEADGIMGNVTVGAILAKNDYESLISDLCYKRWNWLKTLRHWKTFGKGWTRRVMGETVGFQEGDYGVIDRAVKLLNNEHNIPMPKAKDDGAWVKTDDIPEKRTETVKEGFTFDNIAKVGAGSIPAWLSGLSMVPEGPIQWALAALAVAVGFVVVMWAIKKLK